MEREVFISRHLKAYMEIEFNHPKLDYPIVCMLLQVDFDEGILTLRVFDWDDCPFTKKEFDAHISNCSFPKRKLKLIKS